MQNISMFELTSPTYKIEKPIRLIELFAGVGSQAMALRNIGADFEHHRVVEFDKYAIESYNAIHDTNFETMDITKTKGEDLGITETGKYTYLMTYSFPCQDLSLAGNQKGMSRESGTRSGLLWEVERLLKEVKELPEVLLMENVPQVIGQKNIQDFRQWQYFLEDLGYSNFVDTLNAKNYGVAQNRERTFMVSILGDWFYRFPKPIPLEKTIKDYLEPEVDEKYYIKNDKAKELINQLIESGQLEGKINFADGSINEPKTREIMNCITARYDCGISNQKSVGGVVVEKEIKGGIYTDNSKDFFRGIQKDGLCRTLKANIHDAGVVEKLVCEERTDEGIRLFKNNICGTLRTIDACGDKRIIENEVKQVGNIIDTGSWDNPQRGRIYSTEGICPCLNTVGGGGLEPKIIEPMIVASRGRNPNNPSDRTTGAEMQQRLEPNSQGICNTLTSVQKDNYLLEPTYRIRKLTPLECWRLMGFKDEDFYKAEKVNSNSQLYKQAGNSIVVDVLEGIFNQMIGVV